MKKVLLIDVDSKIPNLALMKISAWKKSQGCEVGFNVDDPDEVWASCVFEKNRHLMDGLEFMYPNAEIHKGGGGWSLDISLPAEVEKLKPDYSLYPECDYDLGFSSRGCIRKCYFCVVPRKEGAFHIVQHPSEWHDPGHRKIVFLDNNILADEQWFMTVTDWVIENGLKVSFNQGLDARLITERVAKRIHELKPLEAFRIAWDVPGAESSVVRAIGLLKDAGLNVRSKLICYCYVHDDSQKEFTLYRCNRLKELNVLPYVMLNQDHQFSPELKVLRRWTQPAIFFRTKFEEYLKSRKNKMY